MYLKMIICLWLSFFSSALFAQQYREKTPLHAFFKNNFDSTIIYYGWSSWNTAPNYLIISRKDNNTYYFTYTSPYRKMFGYKIPGDLDVKFMLEQLKFENTPPDTNRYFLPVKIHHSVRNEFWTDVNAYNIWKLNDNIPEATRCSVSDGGEDTYYLISKSGIKTMSFYEAKECSPININNQLEIKTKNVFIKIFDNQK